MTLEDILTNYFGYNGEGLNGWAWNDALTKLISVVEFTGLATGCIKESEKILNKLYNKLYLIDDRDGEI